MGTQNTEQIEAYVERLSDAQKAKVSALAHARTKALGYSQCRTGGAIWERALFEVLEDLLRTGADIDEIELVEDRIGDRCESSEDHPREGSFGYVREWQEATREPWRPRVQPSYLFAMPDDPATLEQFQLFAMLCDLCHEQGMGTDVIPNNASREEAQRMIDEWSEKVAASTCSLGQQKTVFNS